LLTGCFQFCLEFCFSKMESKIKANYENEIEYEIEIENEDEYEFGGIKMSEKKKLWLRAGITVELTEDEFKSVSEDRAGGSILRHKIESGYFELNGETYSPENTLYCGEDEWPHSKDIEYEFSPKGRAKDGTR